MADNNNGRTSTSTQIRNLYSDGMSCMNIQFYNTNLSFRLYPFTGKDQAGRSRYDSRSGQQTTVDYEGAYALYQVAADIIDGKVRETNISIPCNGATITIDRKADMSGNLDTIFSITKNNMTIPFKFQTLQQQVKDASGQVQVKVLEVGLGSFMKTIEGYLNGINADRHLDKLTEDYAKLQEGRPQNGNNQGQNNRPYNGGGNNGGGYRPHNNYKRPYNGNGGGYNNNRGNNYQQQNQQPQQTGWGGGGQNLSDYQLPQN